MKKDLPKYKITIDDLYSDGEDLGINLIANTSRPAIKKKGFSFSEVKKIKGVFADDLKYRISGPIMKRMDIYRYDDESDEEYYVEFDKVVINDLMTKFMMNLDNKKNNFNDEHTDKKSPCFLLYAWEEEDGDEIWITTQFTDKEVYQEYVDAGKTGYSIEGFLGMKMSEFIDKQKNNKQKMNQKEQKLNDFGPYANITLPAGEWTIGDKVYTVKEAVENEGTEDEYRYTYIDTMVPVSGEMPVEEAPADDTQLSEETKLAEQTDEEKKAEEDAKSKEEETQLAEGDMPVEEAPAVEEPKVDTYTKEEVDAKFEEIYKMIADLKAGKEEPVKEELNKEEKLSIHDRMSLFANFSKNNNVRL
jgi:hypothetical protein